MKLPYRFEIRSWTNNVNSDWVEMVHEPWLCDSVNKNGTAFSARIWIERNSFLKSSLWMCCFWVRRHTVFFFIFGHIFVSGFSFIRFKFLRSINNINTDAVNYIVSSIYTTHRLFFFCGRSFYGRFINRRKNTQKCDWTLETRYSTMLNFFRGPSVDRSITVYFGW